nr:MAG TPA: hypothetical protein [Caudoviricetes sp.]
MNKKYNERLLNPLFINIRVGLSLNKFKNIQNIVKLF